MSQHQPPAEGTWARWPPTREPPDKQRIVDITLTVAAYLALVLFGAGQGLLGSFFYAWGNTPLAALGFDLAIGATCLLGGWGMRSPVGGLAPALGWFVVVFLLATSTSGGSLVITATTAGESFLFGGSASVAVCVAICFALWSKPASGRPARVKSR